MVRATLIRLRLTPSIWLMVASTMWKNSAITTMKIAGALPMPNRKIATGSQAIGDTGDSSVMVGSVSFSKSQEIADQPRRCVIDSTDGDQQAGQHARGRRQIGDQHRHRRAIGPRVEADADLPALRRVEELRLLGEVAEEDVRRRQQLGVGQAERPAAAPRSRRTVPTDSSVQPSACSAGRDRVAAATKRRGGGERSPPAASACPVRRGDAMRSPVAHADLYLSLA